MTALEQYIKACFGVTDEEMAILYDLFVPVTIKKGAYFLKTGRQCDKLGFVQSGLLRVFTTVEADREVTQWIASPGYFITDLAGLVLGRHSKKGSFPEFLIFIKSPGRGFGAFLYQKRYCFRYKIRCYYVYRSLWIGFWC